MNILFLIFYITLMYKYSYIQFVFGVNIFIITLFLFLIIRNIKLIEYHVKNIQVSIDNIIIYYEQWGKIKKADIKISQLTIEHRAVFSPHRKSKLLIKAQNLKIIQHNHFGWSMDVLESIYAEIENLKKAG